MQPSHLRNLFSLRAAHLQFPYSKWRLSLSWQPPCSLGLQLFVPHRSTCYKNLVTSSLKDTEIAKFEGIADTWWDREGSFKPLHAMNAVRLKFICASISRSLRKDIQCEKPLDGLKIVDVGCGGGLVTEPLSRMGAIVTGIDAAEKSIHVARLHADLDPTTSDIEYRCTTAEKLIEEHRKFDAVIALEVIEHVADPGAFCKSLAELAQNGGIVLVSTVNRTLRSLATVIIAAEYVLHWLPKGTHDWSTFISPEELVLLMKRASIHVDEMAGFTYNPLTGRWSLSDDISVNFIASGTKIGT